VFVPTRPSAAAGYTAPQRYERLLQLHHALLQEAAVNVTRGGGRTSKEPRAASSKREEEKQQPHPPAQQRRGGATAPAVVRPSRRPLAHGFSSRASLHTSEEESDWASEETASEEEADSASVCTEQEEQGEEVAPRNHKKSSHTASRRATALLALQQR